MSREDGGPAFPAKVNINTETQQPGPYQFGNNSFCEIGMTLRDYFAAAVLRAMAFPHEYHDGRKQIAERAYAIADAMLAQRQK